METTKRGEVTYRIFRRPSIFTSRNNAQIQLEDVTVLANWPGLNHGGRYDGILFDTVRRWAAEDGSTLSESGLCDLTPQDIPEYFDTLN